MRLRVALVCLLAAACSMAPEYERPVMPVPQDFRASGPTEQSFADLDTWQLPESPRSPQTQIEFPRETGMQR